MNIRRQLLSATFLPILMVSTTIASDLPPPVLAAPPMVIQNSDGTFTVQKSPPKGTSKDSRVKAGLVVPPQVVVPIIPTPQKKR